jgi:hypothetical protein
MESAIQTFREKAELLYNIAMEDHNRNIKEDPGKTEQSFRTNLQYLEERLTELRHHIAYSEYKGEDQDIVFGKLDEEVDKFRQRFLEEAEKPESA